MLSLAIVFALIAVPVAIWALPFRACRALNAGLVRGLDRFFAWAFPRQGR
ncbi:MULTISPECIES: hypothetical protein [Paracoccus]|nr:MULTISPECIES: hypothetical protein [Paracoccus]